MDVHDEADDCLEDPIVMVCGATQVPICGDDMPGIPSQGDFIRPAIPTDSTMWKLAEAHRGWFRIKHVCHDLQEGRIIYLVEPGSP